MICVYDLFTVCMFYERSRFEKAKAEVSSTPLTGVRGQGMTSDARGWRGVIDLPADGPALHRLPSPSASSPNDFTHDLQNTMAGDHKCPVCQATFTRPQHVARHMRSREFCVQARRRAGTVGLTLHRNGGETPPCSLRPRGVRSS
jgi:hypothetical protein